MTCGVIAELGVVADQSGIVAKLGVILTEGAPSDVALSLSPEHGVVIVAKHVPSGMALSPAAAWPCCPSVALSSSLLPLMMG